MEVGDAKDHQAGGKSSKCRVLSGALSNHGRSVIGSVQREGNDGKKCSLSMDHCGSTDSTNESDESECIPIENSITSSSDSSQCNEDEGRGKKAKWRKTSNSASFRSQYNDSKREGKSQKRKKALSSFRSKYDEDKGHGKKVKRCKTSPSTTSGVSSQQAEDEIRGISLNHSRKGKTKQDRSKLRRGKWSVSGHLVT